jgi:hypothetical protein
MNEDRFIDVLSRGLQIPEPVEWTRLTQQYQEYYKTNPWQIPIDNGPHAWGKVVLNYVNKRYHKK